MYTSKNNYKNGLVFRGIYLALFDTTNLTKNICNEKGEMQRRISKMRRWSFDEKMDTGETSARVSTG